MYYDKILPYYNADGIDFFDSQIPKMRPDKILLGSLFSEPLK